jgi:hypothetical protein
MKKHTADLLKFQEQQQHNLDTLSERIATLYNKEQNTHIKMVLDLLSLQIG